MKKLYSIEKKFFFYFKVMFYVIVVMLSSSNHEREESILPLSEKMLSLPQICYIFLFSDRVRLRLEKN